MQRRKVIPVTTHLTVCHEFSLVYEKCSTTGIVELLPESEPGFYMLYEHAL